MCAPDAPDPVKTATAQAGINTQTAVTGQLLNMVNQQGPGGSLTYAQSGQDQVIGPDGKPMQVPRYTATTQLSPTGQAAFDANARAGLNMASLAEDQSARLGDVLGREFTPTGLPAFGAVPEASRLQMMGGGGPIQRSVGDGGAITRTYGGDFSQDRQEAEDALMARMAPSMAEDRAALEARLASQGIAIGSEAYGASMDGLARAETDARMAAILGAGDEQARMVGMERDRATFENAAQGQAFGQGVTQGSFANAAEAQRFGQNVTAITNNNAAKGTMFGQDMARFGAQNDLRGQSLAEQLTLRNQPINEVAALMSGGQVQMPSFVNTPDATVPGVDYQGLVNGAYGQDLEAWNKTWGGIMGLANPIIAARFS